MMQYGHFKRQRGIANSRSHEVLYLCYKHKAPKNLAKTRKYVDSGSAVWNQVVRNVPILSHKNHALVTKAVREESLQTMIGVDVAEEEAKEDEAATAKAIDEDEGEQAAPADAGGTEKAIVTAAMRKRKLYRQLTGSEVPWFPHDNDIELLKELCHEAGKPRWVYFGTPAGGAGIHGCIEMGCSVLALCFDEHHKKNLQPFLVQRAVEAMLGSSTMVFRNEDLLARAKDLNITKAKDDTKEDGKKKDEKEDKKKEEDGKKEDEKEEDKKKEKKKEKKEDKKKEDKKKRKQASSGSTSDYSSPSTEESSPKKKKRNKKA